MVGLSLLNHIPANNMFFWRYLQRHIHFVNELAE